MNMEPLQILRYTDSGEYQLHHDFVLRQPGQPAGPRIFTFFLYLNDVNDVVNDVPSNSGATWFPHAAVNSSDPLRPVPESELKAFYSMYSVEKAERLMHGGMHEQCCSKPLAPARHHFRGVGLRVVPKRGAAILLPNIDLNNVCVRLLSFPHLLMAGSVLALAEWLPSSPRAGMSSTRGRCTLLTR